MGDPRQLPEVEAGGAFGVLAKALPVIELTENRRQREAWERQALSELRSGSVTNAIEAYGADGPRPPGPERQRRPSAHGRRLVAVGPKW